MGTILGVPLPMTGGPFLAKRRDPKAPPGSKYSFTQLRNLWIRHGGPGGIVADTAAAIALAESGGVPSRVNSIGATGLWQIHPGGNQYLNPDANAEAAVAKYRGAGGKFTPWTTYTGADTPGHRKTYLDFMPKQGLPGSEATPAIKGAVDTATAIPKFIGTLSSAIFNPDWWLRVGLILLGIVALVGGVYFIGREFVSEQASTIVKSALPKKGN